MEVVRKRGLHHDAERAERRAGRDRIGGVGRHQQRRLVAAPHRTLEAARDLDPEQHLAGLQEIVELGDAVHLAGEAEVAGVLQRLQHRTRQIAVLLDQHRRRQMPRRGVDGIAEQQELHHRDHHDHRERDAVAAKLDEFLDQHRKAAPPEAEARLRDVAIAVGNIGSTHWKLSFERFMRSMNTSSSDGSLSCQCHPLFSR